MTTDSKFSRRDFLKLMALTPAALAARPLLSLPDKRLDSALPNVLIFVFDAWAASNVQFYGYPRLTMPGLERFAERAFVYHNHYSAGCFTVPGTGSLLTSLQPWTHRAFQLTAGGVTDAHQDHNIFTAFSKTHATFGYAQNPYADVFLQQFGNSIDRRLPMEKFNLDRALFSSMPIFENDARMAFLSFEDKILRNSKGPSGSVYFADLWRLFGIGKDTYFRKKYLRKYYYGIPAAGSGSFLVDKVVNGAIAEIRQFSPPTLAYFHFFPPHDPYTPKREYAAYFDDGWNPPDKPIHPVSHSRRPLDEIHTNRLRYDQHLASWDSEIARLFDYLETSGVLDNSIVVITSDHGELFERGEVGHMTSLISKPIVWVPLLISLPGQTQRKDIHAFTSSVDVLPTLASLAGTEPPFWTEGRRLPGLGGDEHPDRGIYSMDAKSASSFSAIDGFSISLVKQGHRLVYYKHTNFTGFEFYNLDEDSEELNDLFPSKPALAIQMKAELLQKIEEFNRPYRK